MFEGIAIVAPYTGAWIEINVENIDLSTFLKSHPTRVRGLKSADDIDYHFMNASHPTRVRGLKFDVE